jgi:hypothetical protein
MSLAGSANQLLPHTCLEQPRSIPVYPSSQNLGPLGAILSYWTFATSRGAFTIVERSSRGVDLFFGQQRLALYGSPVEAAEVVAKGAHPELPCAPETGQTLGVPQAVHEWTFVRCSP